MQQSVSKLNGTIIWKKVISTLFILVLEPKYKIKFRTIRPKPSSLGATIDICVASDFTTCQ